jgi:hypothetical protein
MAKGELRKILTDKGLARLGDAYVNFIYSLALTEIEGTPTGVKVSDRILAEAAKASGLKGILPKRTGRDDVANAVEALLVYAWRHKLMTSEEAIDILKRNPNPRESFTHIIEVTAKRVQSLLGFRELGQITNMESRTLE